MTLAVNNIVSAFKFLVILTAMMQLETSYYINSISGQSNKDSGVNKYDIPESILMNVAGHLLMFQRDWSGPQPKQSTNRYRPVSET